MRIFFENIHKNGAAVKYGNPARSLLFDFSSAAARAVDEDKKENNKDYPENIIVIKNVAEASHDKPPALYGRFFNFEHSFFRRSNIMLCILLLFDTFI